MATFGERLARAAQLLASVTETPRLDAELLLSRAAGLSRAQLLSRLKMPCDAPGFDALLKRRLAHEPLAYIFGEWEFFSLPLRVIPPLLVPRPETEHLVEAVLEHVAADPARVLDLCTGTGCVAIAIAHNAPRTRIVATDIDGDALAVAAENAARHGVSCRIEFKHGDLFQAIGAPRDAFDVICANPPYVEDGAWPELPPVIRLYEAPQALLAGPEGLDVVTRIAAQAPRYLAPGGLLAIEVGDGQYGKVAAILDTNGYSDIGLRCDLAGIKRVITARGCW